MLNRCNAGIAANLIVMGETDGAMNILKSTNSYGQQVCRPLGGVCGGLRPTDASCAAHRRLLRRVAQQQPSIPTCILADLRCISNRSPLPVAARRFAC